MFDYGEIKYKLRLMGLANVPFTVTLQLLDANGFMLKEERIFSSKFAPVPGTTSVEATGSIRSSESDYRKARDYLVK